jgi:hypothetical protein
MKLYFDTNIYRFISERNETRHVSEIGHRQGFSLLAH